MFIPITSDIVIADVVHIPKFNVTTTDLTNSTASVVKNNAFNGLNQKPAKSLLAQFDLIEWPNSLHFSDLSINSTFSYRTGTSGYAYSVNLFRKSINNLSAFPSFMAYVAPDLNFIHLTLHLNASDNLGTKWGYFGTMKLGDKNISISPKITVIPEFSIQQQGAVIRWSKSNVVQTSQEVSILNTAGKSRVAWNFEIKGDSSQITLANIPLGTTALLTKGIQYNLELNENYFILYLNQ